MTKRLQFSHKRLLVWLIISLLVGGAIGAVSIGGGLWWHFTKRLDSHPKIGARRLLHHFERIDRNPKDGFIDAQEQQKSVAFIIRRIDDNEDGLVSEEEIPRFMRHWDDALVTQIQQQPRSTQFVQSYFVDLFQTADTNRDQLLSFEEFRVNQHRQAFQRIDRNQDGVINFEEFATPTQHHSRRTAPSGSSQHPSQ